MRKLHFLIIAFVLSLAFFGCQQDSDDEDTYTVYTDSTSYDEFIRAVNSAGGNYSVQDGYYSRIEITQAQYNSTFKDLYAQASNYRHEWTEDEIKSWFIGRGFGNSEATKETSWIITADHGMIISRTGSIVYVIMK